MQVIDAAVAIKAAAMEASPVLGRFDLVVLPGFSDLLGFSGVGVSEAF